MRRPKGPRTKTLWTFHFRRHGLNWIAFRNLYRKMVEVECLMWCWPCDCSWCLTLSERILSMKVPKVCTGASDGPGQAKMAAWLAACPLVAEVCCDPWWGEEALKGERALFVFWGQGEDARVILKVASPAVKLATAGADADEAMALLDLTLNSEDVPWQQDERPLKGPPKLGKKKS